MSSDPQTTDQRDAPELREESDIEAEHRQAQESGEMFEGRRYGER